MRCWLAFAFLTFAAPVMANEPSTIMDVAPTTLELTPGAAGLFFVTNHGSRPVTVQIEAMDWRQAQGRDVLTPSHELFASPPQISVAAGGRQTVRVMANPASDGEHAYRLLVSELPDASETGDGVHVLLQFSVPVFVRHDPKIAPQLTWSGRGGRISATNSGRQTVKLVKLEGVADPGLIYLLPGATRDFGEMKAPLHLRAHDARSGADIVADVAP